MSFGTRVSKDAQLGEKYIIWSPTSTLPPTVVFNTRPEAIKCAHLMATKNKGERFAVCKIVGEAQTEIVKYQSFCD